MCALVPCSDGRQIVVADRPPCASAPGNAPSYFIAAGKTATFVARTGISGRPSWPKALGTTSHAECCELRRARYLRARARAAHFGSGLVLVLRLKLFAFAAAIFVTSGVVLVIAAGNFAAATGVLRVAAAGDSVVVAGPARTLRAVPAGILSLAAEGRLAGHCHVNRKFADQMTMAVTVHAAMVAWRHVSIA